MSDYLRAVLAGFEQHADAFGNKNGWVAVAWLYAGALLECAPGVEPERFPDCWDFLGDQPVSQEFRPPLDRWILELSEAIEQSTTPELCGLSNRLIETLGFPLLQRMLFVLSRTRDVPSLWTPEPSNADPSPVMSVFRVPLRSGYSEYHLYPSLWLNGDHLRSSTEVHARLWGRFLPTGLECTSTSTRPTWVRMVEHQLETQPQMIFLERQHPNANRTLAERAQNGLRVAVIPLPQQDCGVGLSVVVQGATPDNRQFFRLNETSGALSSVWETAIQQSVSQCQTHQVDVMVLPELIVTPRVEKILLTTLNSLETGPLLVFAGSAHRGKSKFANRMHIYARHTPDQEEDGTEEAEKPLTLRPQRPYQKVGWHDKFSLYGNDKKKRPSDPAFLEANEPGKGLTFLVTSIGIFAVGICKDWFFNRDAKHGIAGTYFKRLAPQWAIIPAWTNSLHDIESYFRTFHDLGTIVILCNACSGVQTFQRKKLNPNQDCSTDTSSSDASSGNASPKLYDVRSFVAAPASLYALSSLEASGQITRKLGMIVVKQPCGSCEAGVDNGVFAQMSPSL